MAIARANPFVNVHVPSNFRFKDRSDVNHFHTLTIRKGQMNTKINCLDSNKKNDRRYTSPICLFTLELQQKQGQ